MVNKSIKKRMSAWTMTLTALTLSLLLSVGSASAQIDPGIPDTVEVESVQVNAGDKFGVPVRFFNDEPLTGGSLGFAWGTTDLKLDSISFVGSRLIADATRNTQTTIDNANSQGLSGFFIISEPPVPTGVGNWATLWFTAAPGAADQIVPLDSAFLPPAGEFIFVSDEQLEFAPQFALGTVTIGNPPANAPPVLAPIGPQSVDEGQTLSIRISATDAASIPILSALNLPLNSSFVDSGNGAGSFTFSPNFFQAGQFNVSFIASDWEFADTEVVTITVNNANRPPVLATIGNQSVDEGSNLNFVLRAFDPERGPLSFSVSPPLPANATLVDNNDGTATFDFSPDFTQAGQTSHTFRVTDTGALSDSETVTITVIINVPPTLATIGNKSVDEGANLNFMLSASDPNGGPLSFSVSPPLPANATLVDHHNGTATVDFSPDFTQAGQTSHTFRVTDNGALSDTETVTITVNDINLRPTITTVRPQTAMFDDTLSFQIIGGDPDNDPLAFSAVGLPTGATFLPGIVPNIYYFDWIPAATQVGIHNVTFVVNDGNLADSEVVVITVSELPVPDSAFISPDTLWFTMTEGDLTDQIACAWLESVNAPAGYTVVPETDCVINSSPSAPEGVTNDSVCVSVNAGGFLAPGEYFCRFLYFVEGDIVNNPIELIINLTVQVEVGESIGGGDSANISPDTLYFSAPEGADVILRDCAWLSSTNAPREYSAFVNSPPESTFTSLENSTGGTDDSSCVTVNPSGLSAGTYYNSVMYNVAGTSPVELVVCLNVRAPQSTAIQLDIKPGSCPNPLNIKGRNAQGKAVLPVALLGTEDFDVRDIDVSSLALEGVSPVRHNFDDVSAPPEVTVECGCVEDSTDGHEDLTLKFYHSDLISSLGNLHGVSQLQLTLTGKLNDGSEFSASDCIVIRPKEGASSEPIGESGIPNEFTLIGNYPNPFNPVTKITFGTPRASHVMISIYNILGQKVATLLNEERPAGYHSVTWDASNSASGVYFYRLKADGFIEKRKMIMLK